jgi:hypothetical protein
MSNKAWKLQTFVDALVYELDRARTTLSVKGINSPLSYAVKDMDVELQVFPEYDGDDVKFTLAGSGQSSSSKIAFTLGSITDRQIRESSKEPAKDDDMNIDELELDNDVKKDLRKLGVDTVKDINRIQDNNINIRSAMNNTNINFGELANKIRAAKEKNRRTTSPPYIRKTSLSKSMDNELVQIQGDNLHIFSNYKPKAFVNKQEVEILSHTENIIELKLDVGKLKKESMQLTLFLDPFTIVNCNLG